MSDFDKLSTKELEEQMAHLRRELARRKSSDGVDLTAMELEIEHDSRMLGALALQERLDALAPEDGAPRKCPKCKKSVAVKARYRERQLETLSGAIRYARAYYYCSGCRFGFYPRDEELGIPTNGQVSRELEKRLLDFAINDSYEQGAERWNFHYSKKISSNLLRRVVDRASVVLNSSHEAALHHELKESPRVPPELLVVQNDGGMVPTRGDEPWKEAKLAVIFRGEHHAKRSSKRGMISQARYVGVLGPQKEFKKSLDVALRMDRALKAKTVVWVGDGAPSNWNLAGSLVPKAVQILDWCHAVEAAMVCGKILLGEDSPYLSVWKDSVERRLMSGRVDELLAELDQLRFAARGKARKAVIDLKRYYFNNQPRMNYPKYIHHGWLIGSGVVESGHRHVVQRRMKNAGQHWSISRGRNMVRLRAAYQTAGCRRFHSALYRARNLTQTGKIPIYGPTKRRASNR